MEDIIENKNEEIIDAPAQKTMNKVKIFALVSAGIVIITTVFLVGYFQFGWFQKPQDNIIANTYHPNQVLLFNEYKTISTEVSTESGKEVVDQDIKTDFMVVINSKTKLNYFGEIDNLYNATLVILKTKSNDQIVGGLNLTEDEEAEKFFNNPENDGHPMAKFAFYENGTLVDIYLSNDTNQFYASSMVDLIEHIIPKISKKVFNQENKDVEYKFDEEENTLHEKHFGKEFVDKYSKISFKGSQINKKITRMINNNTINQITSESELNLVSDKDKDKENFLNLGLDGYTIKINTDLNIVENKDDKELIKKIEKMSKEFGFEESQKMLEELAKNEMRDLLNLVNEAEKKEGDNEKENENELRRLGGAATQSYDITNVEILGKRVYFKYVVSYENNRAQHYLDASVGGNTVRLSTSTMTFSGGVRGSISAPICTIPFTLGIPLVFKLIAKGDYNNNFSFKSNYRKNGNVITVSGTLNAYLDGSLSSSAKFISLNVGVEGRIININGSKTCDVVSRAFSGVLTATTGPVKLYVNVKLANNKNYYKVLCQTGYLSRRF